MTPVLTPLGYTMVVSVAVRFIKKLNAMSPELDEVQNFKRMVQFIPFSNHSFYQFV